MSKAPSQGKATRVLERVIRTSLGQEVMVSLILKDTGEAGREKPGSEGRKGQGTGAEGPGGLPARGRCFTSGTGCVVRVYSTVGAPPSPPSQVSSWDAPHGLVPLGHPAL